MLTNSPQKRLVKQVAKGGNPLVVTASIWLRSVVWEARLEVKEDHAPPLKCLHQLKAKEISGFTALEL
jgi:hypothetical protein